MLGGPISDEIMRHFDGVNGMDGWQWVFLWGGLPVVGVGILLYALLANSPKEAKWPSAEEKALVADVMAADRAKIGVGADHGCGLKAALTDPRVYLLSFIYFVMTGGAYTLTFWLPTMIRTLGIQDVALLGWISAIPYVFGAIGLLILSYTSDRFRERRWHVSITLIGGAVALYLTRYTEGVLVPRMILLSIAAFFIFAQALFWSIPPTYLPPHAAASGIAVVSSLGILGGFVSPTIVGYIRDLTGDVTMGPTLMGVIIIAGGIATLALPKSATRV